MAESVYGETPAGRETRERAEAERAEAERAATQRQAEVRAEAARADAARQAGPTPAAKAQTAVQEVKGRARDLAAIPETEAEKVARLEAEKAEKARRAATNTAEPEKEKTYYIVNPSGAVHSVTRAHARDRLGMVGWRMASAAEIATYKEQRIQRSDQPIAQPFSPDPDAQLAALP